MENMALDDREQRIWNWAVIGVELVSYESEDRPLWVFRTFNALRQNDRPVFPLQTDDFYKGLTNSHEILRAWSQGSKIFLSSHYLKVIGHF